MKLERKIFKTAIQEILVKEGTDEVLSEAAFPAYAHKNPLIDYIFWKRLKIVVNYIIKKKQEKTEILDFGCGSGVFSYTLASKGSHVTAIDLNLKPVRILSEKIKFPQNIHFIENDIFKIDFKENKFDYIVALDVLEHIPIAELDNYLELFINLLKENGEIIISGPTENVIYKIGRKLAGNDFTGHYHETDIVKIKQVFLRKSKIHILSKIFWPITLFEVFVTKKG
ncbi:MULTISPECIES: class I SAM-dependent methyltransferase [Flavobacterium]|uniref:Class I SAM-dependent methyltransferase n=1 Tax=Flavobacterium covae TaxID=2906076 RepID=A0ABW8PFJ6_9FLAO|nr:MULTISPECIES: class I SAM-dependent methyltransferase [Flavobacterium]OXA76510.1 SAM-dependent methyltransferase [Flavobacterium columnare NBRC 100251 = ATCC 23463]AMA49799.1 hypothetical protein AWN65_10240 [Flavobacterium covae]AND64675.1 hypothetical protein AX766_09695 [Flavobacterium covae]MCJ1805667.1 class I SAM-dependent methyltransferase [Flavobacterium covae]MCJ1809809.1 class I SAM-dependent methyltransferase [Flavobacterium covae]